MVAVLGSLAMIKELSVYYQVYQFVISLLIEGEKVEASGESSWKMRHLLWRLQTLRLEEVWGLFKHLSNRGRSKMPVLQVRNHEGVAHLW